jgi:predicted nucleic acid-binding Zn ribbon protein
MDPVYRRLIETFRRSPNWDEQLDLELLQKLWPSLVGERLASAATVVAIHGSKVVINVPSQVWRRQLIGMKRELLKRINEPWSGSKITEIAFTHED